MKPKFKFKKPKIKIRYSGLQKSLIKYKNDKKFSRWFFDAMKDDEFINTSYHERIKMLSNNSDDNSVGIVTPIGNMDKEFMEMSNLQNHIFLETEELYEFLSETKINLNNNYKEIFNELITSELTNEEKKLLPSQRILSMSYGKFVKYVKEANIIDDPVIKDVENKLNNRIKMYSGWIHVPNKKYSIGFCIKLIIDKDGNLVETHQLDGIKNTKRKLEIPKEDPIAGAYLLEGLSSYVYVDIPFTEEDSYMCGTIIDSAIIQESIKNYKSNVKSNNASVCNMEVYKAYKLIFNLMFYIHAFPDKFVSGTPNPKENELELCAVLYDL